MARPLRIEFPGAIYHVTSRGDRREDIFVDDVDRRSLLDCVGRGMKRFDAEVLAYCLMGNHYHFVIHTRSGRLSDLMRHINGVYTQAFNRRHDKVGHLFQGRFKAILIDRDSYLFEVCRYVELNPVRADIVPAPPDWQWSSYRAHVGMDPCPGWLDAVGLHGYVLGREVTTATDRRRAQSRYAELVASAEDVDLWSNGLRQQIYLGDEAFVEKMQAQGVPSRMDANEVPRAQRSTPVTLAEWLRICSTRDEAIVRAHAESRISMSAIARELGLSVSRVSRLVAASGQGQARGKT